MSIKLMSMVYALPKETVKAPAKAVLQAMADNAWDDGSNCFPSRGLIEWKTNLSHNTVDVAIRELKDAFLIYKVGVTSMGVVEWQIDVGVIEAFGVPFKPKRPYPKKVDLEQVDPIPGEGTRDTLSRVQTVSEPSIEPTYIQDDGDGAPLEHIMVYHDILAAWKEKFPTKRQPGQSNVKMQRKVKSRLKVPTFKARLWVALQLASNSPSLVRDSWFQLEYLLRNDDNYEKVASGEFDWKDNGKQVADPVPAAAHKNVGVISDKSFKPGPNSK